MKKGGEHGLRSPPNDFQTAVKLGQAIGDCPSFRSISLIPMSLRSSLTTGGRCWWMDIR
jgi:hypothetical protein